MNKIAFITGSRSEVGALKGVIEEFDNSAICEYCIILHGAHNLELFGNTSKELAKQFEKNLYYVDTISNTTENKKELFINSIFELYSILEKETINCIYLVGDRIEAYAAALAAHMLNIKIFHYGGGNISNGSNDNIYRYNITNLSNIHFATSLYAYNRLKALPTIAKEKIHFVGSSAVDSILDFLKNPISIEKYIPELSDKKFVLMTFHPSKETKERTCQVMNFIIEHILNHKINLLITYPNHDFGFQSIINIIEKWQSHELVHVAKHLGKTRYYSALYSSEFVIGNTSSGFVEVPYFSKVFYNVGSRQEGRDGGSFVKNLSLDLEQIEKELNVFKHVKEMKGKTNTKIYGNGNAVSKIINIIKSEVLKWE